MYDTDLNLCCFENQICMVAKTGIRLAVCERRVKQAFPVAFSENTASVKIVEEDICAMLGEARVVYRRITYIHRWASTSL